METKAQLKHPVIEIFGPTIQGEGILVGQPVHFIRFGGCDYRCSWCDTKYAVEPKEVIENSTMKTADQIMYDLELLDGDPGWVVLSGGNPALQHLDHLMDLLHARGYKVTIETQGTVFRDWIRRVDKVTVSPKPPSSGNVTTMEKVNDFANSLEKPWSIMSEKERERSGNIVQFSRMNEQLSFKVVVFDHRDLEYLRELVRWADGDYPIFLSIGTEVGEDTRADLCDKWREWAEYVAKDPELGNVRVLAQCHVLLWGHGRGF